MSTSLKKLLATMGPMLEGSLPLDDAQLALYGPEPSPSKKNLAIYRRFCATHRESALAHVYMYCKQVLGERWRETVERYFRAHPMHHVEINENGDAFGPFLQGAEPAFLPELADFEWWEWQTRTARNPGATSAIAGTVEVRPYHYDFIAWREAPNEPPPERETLVIFWRDRSDQPRRERLYAGELEVLRAVNEGRPVRAELDDDRRDLLDAGILVK